MFIAVIVNHTSVYTGEQMQDPEEKKPGAPDGKPSADTRAIGRMMLHAIFVGVLAGYGALAFRWLIRHIDARAFGNVLGFASGGDEMLAFVLLPLIPAIGGLLVGIIGHFFAPEVYYSGIPEVVENMVSDKKSLKHRTVWAKLLSSSITLGTGGSAGREGPIVMIGSSFGSVMGTALKLPADYCKILLAAGAAGGISATFNAPIAGVIFAIEVLTKSFRLVSVMPIIVTSVTANFVFRLNEGDIPMFRINAPEHIIRTFVHPEVILTFILTGLVAGLLALMFLKMLFYTDGVFDRLKMPTFLKPAFGGLLVGVAALSVPFLNVAGATNKPVVLGVGYETVESLFYKIPALEILFIILVIKFIVTALTIGSGGSGGTFAPSLFMGAFVGAIITKLLALSGYNVAGMEGIYIIAGMSAFVSGITLAPLSTFIILFEMSQHYDMLFPLMISSVLSAYLVKHFGGVSVYNLKLMKESKISD